MDDENSSSFCYVRGDPEKCDTFGNTGLHLASAKGHMECVAFLVNFGVNIWALDIDYHTPKDLAVLNNREDILRFLDRAEAMQDGSNPKHTKDLKEKSKKEAEKHIKAFQKQQKKVEKVALKEEERVHQDRKRMMILPNEEKRQPLMDMRRSSISMGRRSSLSVDAVTRFSDMVANSVNSRKIPQNAFKKLESDSISTNQFAKRQNEYKLGGNGYSGMREDTEIIYSEKGRSSVDTLLSEERKESPYSERSSSLFNRPSFGSNAFRKSVSAFNNLSITSEEDREDSLESGDSLPNNKKDSSDRLSDLWEDDMSEEECDFPSVQMFLTAVGLSDWIPKFIDEKMDLEALMLLNESDLGNALQMPLGPRKKLMKAISDHKADLASPDILTDTRL